jgi:hypothetical protein
VMRQVNAASLPLTGRSHVHYASSFRSHPRLSRSHPDIVDHAASENLWRFTAQLGCNDDKPSVGCFSEDIEVRTRGLERSTAVVACKGS